MSELDILKEKISYLKVWLGIMVVTDISLFGWLITHLEQSPIQIRVGCILAIVALTAGIWGFHRVIEKHIESLRDLGLWKLLLQYS